MKSEHQYSSMYIRQTRQMERVNAAVLMPPKQISDDSNAICLNAQHASHDVAQVAIHSQVVAFQGLELSMSITMILRWIDYLHLHLHQVPNDK
jgi:hypothetical protein